MFFNGKVKAFETPLIEARQLNAAERKAAVFQFDVPLAQLKPGLYTCQVNVIDDAGGNFIFPGFPFWYGKSRSRLRRRLRAEQGRADSN